MVVPGETDQPGLDRVRGALQVPQPPQGIRVRQVESPGLGHQGPHTGPAPGGSAMPQPYLPGG